MEDMIRSFRETLRAAWFPASMGLGGRKNRAKWQEFATHDGSKKQSSSRNFSSGDWPGSPLKKAVIA